jgi:enamine deaminase RidA (YjgF/YER057c/UK114 family)
MKEVIQPQSLSDPRPRYSQGIVTQPGKMLFIAGQTASDKNGNVVGKGDIEAQAKQVFENLQAVLNRVRNQNYKGNPPTSTLVVVKGLANPDYLIEIAGVAAL